MVEKPSPVGLPFFKDSGDISITYRHTEKLSPVGLPVLKGRGDIFITYRHAEKPAL